MKHRVLSVVAAMVGTVLVVPAATAAPTPPTDPLTAGATALVRGELVLVADAHRGERPGAASRPHDDADTLTAYVDVEGASVVVDPASVEGVSSGSTVTVEVPVPEVVVTAVVRGEPVLVTAGAEAAGDASADTAVIPVGDLDAAEDDPSPLGSDLSAATAVAAGSSGEPVEASVVDVARAEAPPVTRAPHQVTVAVVGVDGKSDSRYTDAEVSRLVSETSRYWSDQTGGAVTFRLAGAVTRWTSTTSCTRPWDLWREAAATTGFQAGPDQHLLLLVPRGAYDAGSCGYGLGTVGNGVSDGGLSYVADTSWPAIAHELGHNMSLQHANRLACTTARADAEQSSTGAPTTAGCSEAAYGDRADVMSSSALTATGGLGVVGLRQLGLMPAAAQQAVTDTGVTSLDLAPLGSGTGLRSVSVTDPRSGTTYYLENRQAAGRDVYGFGGAGMRSATNPHGTPPGLRVLKLGAGGSSVLLDPSPTACSSTCAWDDDVVVAPGTTFASVADGVEIRTRQLPDGAVAVDVSVAGAGQQHWASAPAPSTVRPDAVDGVATAGRPLELTGEVTTATGAPATGTVRVTSGSAATVEAALDGAGRYAAAWTPTRPGAEAVTTTHVTASGQIGGTAERSVRVGEATVVTVATVTARSTAATVLPVTVTTASKVPAASGTVTVRHGDAVVGSAGVSRGRASVRLPAMPRGHRDLTVAYAPPTTGEAALLATSSVPLALDVVGASPRVSVTPVRRSVTIADAPSVTVAVWASGATPTGTVTVVDEGSAVGAGTLVNGRTVIELPPLTLGRHGLVAVYDGDSTVDPGRSAAGVQTVTPLPVSSLTASVTRLVAGQPGTATVTVRAAGRPGVGEVSVVRDGQTLASAALVAGRAALTLPTLPVGRYQLTVVHAGSSGVTGGTRTVTVVVAPARASITAVLDAPTVSQGSVAALAVTVGAPGVPGTGVVRLLRGRTALGEVALVEGRADLSVPAGLPAGRQALTVAFTGSSDLFPGTVSVPVTVVR